jgi:hypothetical protein
MKGILRMGGGGEIELTPKELRDIVHDQGLMPGDVFSEAELRSWASADRYAEEVRSGLRRDEEAAAAAKGEDKGGGDAAAVAHPAGPDKYTTPASNPMIRTDPVD